MAEPPSTNESSFDVYRQAWAGLAFWIAAGLFIEGLIAFRSPALAASPELLRAAKAELSFEFVARPGARLDALLASTTIAGSLLSRVKVSFDSGQAVVDSPLSLAGATALRLSRFAFPDAALTLARLANKKARQAASLFRRWSEDQAAASKAAVSNTLLIGGRFMIIGAGAFLETFTGLTFGSFWATSALSQLPADSLPDTAIE